MADVMSSSYNRHIILFTIFQATVSTLFAVLLGLPGAWLLATKNFPGKKILKAVSSVPFVLPSILVVLGFVIFFGNNGYLNRLLMGVTGLEKPPLRILYSMKAIILAHGFYNFPIVIRLVSSLWEKLDPSLANAAMTMGAGRVRLFFTITLPQILPAVLASAALIFVFCFTSFAIILVLGGGPAFTTLEVEIYRQARISLNMEAAAALSLTGILITLVFVYLNVHFQSSRNYHENIANTDYFQEQRKAPGKIFKWGILLYILFIALLVAAPVISVITKSFIIPIAGGAGFDFSSSAYSDIFRRSTANYGITLLEAIGNSISYAFYTVIFSILFGTLISYVLKGREKASAILDTLFMLPLSVSSVILGLGYLKIMNYLNEPLRSSPVLIILAHTVIAFPFVTRAVKPVMDKIKPELIHAALSLGETPLRVFITVELPLIKSAIFAGAAFAFAISIGEMNATILLSSENTLTIPLMIYRLIGSYNFIAACALGTVLIIFTFLSFIIMDYFGSDTGGF
ncbi:MAG: iron ABC transporter permease [Spirochaetales bacterium]|nr:iron ABC transporter permease [Spirochaetales bacterium]